MKKRLYILLFASVLFTTGFAQSLQDATRLYRHERYTSAENSLLQLTRQNPQQIEPWYWLVRAELAKNEKDKAVHTLKSIPTQLQGQALYKVLEGSIALENIDTVKALAAFTDALGNAKKKDPAIQLAIAEANIDANKGNLLYAIDLLTEAAKKDKKNPAILIAKGDAFRKLYNGSEAFRNYQDALELDKNDPVVNYKIGKIYQTQNNDAVYTEYYENAIKADPDFAPVYYQLYYANYFKDVNKALEYLQKFIAHSDPDTKNDYLLTDLYFVSKKYTEAIQEAGKIIATEKNHTKPRIYKLLAYSYDALNNNAKAEENLKTYFSNENDSNYSAKDFELMASISEKNNQPADAAIWYEKALQLEKDKTQKTTLVKKLAGFYKSQKQYDKQAYWYEQLYSISPENLSNVDVFNWGVANYNAQQYPMADSVFAIYTNKYPEQSFGYYWRARSNAAIDTAMETGIAIPHYENLIKVGLKDSANKTTRKWLIQAYGYIAAYKVNKEKQFDEALACYDKILQLDPGNTDAEKYKGILEKMAETKPNETPKNK
ncbi:MAG: tetratricopeptide repeat protein [Bacteroidota bacterium]